MRVAIARKQQRRLCWLRRLREEEEEVWHLCLRARDAFDICRGNPLFILTTLQIHF